MNEYEDLISKDMLDRMIELAVAKPLTSVKLTRVNPPLPAKMTHAKPLLRDGEYLVRVEYRIPSFAELEQELGKYCVAPIFDGRPFQKHSSCENVDETPGERVMLVKGFGRRIGSEDAIKEMNELGYRPATHLEAYAFLKAKPEMHRLHRIVSLGSFAMFSRFRCVAFVWQDGGRRILDTSWFGGWWSREYRFLLVRK